MSTLAAVKYGAEFAQRGLNPPLIFSGDVVSMMPAWDPAARLPFQPKGALVRTVVDKFRRVSEVAFQYVLEFGPPAPNYDGHIIASNKKRTESIIGGLLVLSGVTTGKLAHIGVEAITREELVGGMLDQLWAHTAPLKMEETRAAFFVVSANFHTTAYTPEVRFGIAAAYLPKDTLLPTPRFLVAPIGRRTAAKWIDSRKPKP